MKPEPVTMWKTPDGKTHESEQAAIKWWHGKRRDKEWEEYFRQRWLRPGCFYRLEDLLHSHEELWLILKGIYRE